METMVPLAMDAISWFFLVVGSVFAVIGGIGIVRLPEFFSRMHGAGITDTMGAGMILVGLMFQADTPLVVVKLLAILFFLTVTSPSSCHALAHSALAQGMKPVLDVRQPRQPEAAESDDTLGKS
ncbi:Na(+)/H(+) antiporter subunit G1 [Rubripirellula lacrimiformis]|uniref:Na(+)/H(+) antiporter subunit G1 n=1 Tax=Rubripirellula lacrimiformis TaxID=1930273 RepID=A0A517NFG9_9BACT|nr:monovalent cation/H(+) antiporter subunit G [Rubripirellula lacrimiformis]QDT05876.1 Na(+)/H(+) antiporter subunit G1 [Rubripirellula lacrimiformis]